MRSERRRLPGVPYHDALGNFLSYVSHAVGENRVREGLAYAVRDFRYGCVRIVRYQETVGATPSDAEKSTVVLTRSETMACSGLLGASRTARLPEWDTKGRDSKHARELARDPRRPAEDFIELACNKVKMWNAVPLHNPTHQAWA